MGWRRRWSPLGKAVRAIARPFIPWIGGKEKLTPYVRQVLPPKPKVYVEPFGGSGAILLGLPPSKTRLDVYNDFNADLVNLFVCVRDSPITLMNELGYLPFHSRAEFEFVKAMLRKENSLQKYLECLDLEIETVQTQLPAEQAKELTEILKGQAELYSIKRAAAFYRLGRGSFNGTFSSFAMKPMDIRAFFKLIADASERLQNVVIENKDAVQLIQDMDGKGVTFYCDPPYYQAEQHYEVAFTEQDHIRLHDVMTAAEVLAMLDDLHALTEHLLEYLQDVCGPCDDFCEEDCPICSRELFHLPNRLLARAGIPENARLCAVPDPENQCIYIEESAPCGFISRQAPRAEQMILEAGICLRELNHHLRKGDVVYGGK